MNKLRWIILLVVAVLATWLIGTMGNESATGGRDIVDYIGTFLMVGGIVILLFGAYDFYLFSNAEKYSPERSSKLKSAKILAGFGFAVLFVFFIMLVTGNA